jgi:hypothetical protein
MEWQLIESAPKDGAFIIGYEAGRAKDFEVTLMWWEIDGDDDKPCQKCGHVSGDWFGTDEDGAPCGTTPTHWMPLPPPPGATK